MQQMVRAASARRSEAGKAKKKGKKGDINISLDIFPIKTKKITQFTRQLSTLQDAGLPLLRSLQILESQQKPGKLKNILGAIVEDVESGSTLSDSMAKHPKAFDRLYSKMVNAGEIGGVIDLILQRLANFMEKAQRLRAKIKGAMIYPVVVIIIAVVIVTGIMYFVIPKFQDIFNDFEVELPGLTLWLIDASAWVAGTSAGQNIPGWVVIVASPFLIFAFFKLIRKDQLRPRVPRLAPVADPGAWQSRREDLRGPLHTNTRHAHFRGCSHSRSHQHHAGDLGQLGLRAGVDQGPRLHPRGRDVRRTTA